MTGALKSIVFYSQTDKLEGARAEMKKKVEVIRYVGSRESDFAAENVDVRSLAAAGREDSMRDVRQRKLRTRRANALLTEVQVCFPYIIYKYNYIYIHIRIYI